MQATASLCFAGCSAAFERSFFRFFTRTLILFHLFSFLFGFCGVSLSFSSRLGGSLSVVLGGKDGVDGEKILCQFVKSSGVRLLGNGRVVVVVCTENHEFDLALLEDVFDEFDSETTESVSMGDHNFCEISLQSGVQNGLKPFAVPVDAASDVGDDLIVRVLLGELLDLEL